MGVSPKLYVNKPKKGNHYNIFPAEKNIPIMIFRRATFQLLISILYSDLQRSWSSISNNRHLLHRRRRLRRRRWRHQHLHAVRLHHLSRLRNLSSVVTSTSGLCYWLSISLLEVPLLLFTFYQYCHLCPMLLNFNIKFQSLWFAFLIALLWICFICFNLFLSPLLWCYAVFKNPQ